MHTLGSLSELWAARNHLQPLADRAECPFLGIDWLASATEAFHQNDQLRVLLLARGGEAAAVAPLVSLQRYGHESLEFIGTPGLFEPAGLLHDGEEALRALVRHLVQLGPLVRLRGLDTSGTTFRVLREVVEGERRGMLLTHGTRTAMTLPIEQSWPDYVGSLSPDVQGDLRGVLDRGADLDDVEFQLMTPSPAEVPELLATLAELAPSPWMSEKGAPLRVFYRALATRAAARGTLRVGVLHAGGRLVAFQWGLEAYRRLWLLSRAHDTAANWSPDVVLMSHLIRVAHEQRLAAVEFWGDDAPWQMRWQPAARTFASTMAVPLTARGLSGLAIDALSRGARRWLPSAWTLPTSPLESGL